MATINLEEITKVSKLELKMTDRFIVKFGEPFDDINSYVVKYADRPAIYQVDDDYEWGTITFKLFDPVAPSTTRAIFKGLEDLKIRESSIINVSITVVDPVGEVIEEWDIDGKIQEIDFGQMSWAFHEPVEIGILLKVQKATVK